MISATDAARHQKLTPNPALAQLEAAAGAYTPNELLDRAAIVAETFPNVKLDQRVVEALPNYLRRRKAAADLLAAGQTTVPIPTVPGAANRYDYDPSTPTKKRIAQPPTDAETTALSKRVSGAVKRYLELRHPMGVSASKMRAAFTAAMWNGTGHVAWAQWLEALRVEANRQTNLDRAAAFIGVDLRDGGGLPLLESGTPYNAASGWPIWADEANLAMNRAGKPLAPPKGDPE